MPCLPTEELHCKVISKNDELPSISAIKCSTPDVLQRFTDVNISNDEQKKGDELDKNQQKLVEEDRNCYKNDVQRKKEDELSENKVIHDEDGIRNSMNVEIVVILESRFAQIGNSNHITLDSEEQESVQETALLHPTGYYDRENVERMKKVPTENTDLESAEKKERPRERIDGCHWGERRSEGSEEDTENSENNLHLTSIKVRKGRAKKSKFRGKDYVKRRTKPLVKVHKSIGPASPSASFHELCEISDDVMFHLQVARDNGRWESFDEIVVTLSHKYQSCEAQIVILLEKGVAACYQSRLEESEVMILKAMNMATGTENSAVLLARAQNYLSGVCRRLNLDGKAENCVEEAIRISNSTKLTALDNIFLAYERACVLMNFVSRCPNPTPGIVNNAKRGLLECINRCIALEGDTTSQRYVKKHHFALIKRAMLLLDCRTASGRKRTVNEEGIKEAKSCLETLKTRYWDGIARGEKVQYYLASADLYFRCKDYPKAEECAKKALDMASEFGFKTEIQPAQDRLKEIRRHCKHVNEEPRFHSNDGFIYISDNSEGQNGDISSCDSDFMDTPACN